MVVAQLSPRACRSPGDDTIAVDFGQFNQSEKAVFSVRDIWAQADLGSFTGSFKVHPFIVSFCAVVFEWSCWGAKTQAPVASRATKYLLLTPDS